MIGVFIVAVMPALRAGLRSILSANDIHVEGEAATLVELAADTLAAIDVLVLANPELLAEGVLTGSSTSLPGMVLLADNPKPVALLHTLAPRGWGIVTPEAPASTLQAAVYAVAEGLCVLPATLSSQFPDQRPETVSITAVAEPLEEPLTTRELEVLELLSRGLSNKLIARTLQISEHTVKFHVSSIYAKLDVANRTEAVHRGAQRGLITL